MSMQSIHQLGSVDADLVVQPSLLALRNAVDAAINGVSIISTAGTAYSKQYSVVQMRETDADGHVSDVTDESRRSYAKFELQDLLRRVRQTRANITQYLESITEPESVSVVARYDELVIIAKKYQAYDNYLDPSVNAGTSGSVIVGELTIPSGFKLDPREAGAADHRFDALWPQEIPLRVMNPTGGLYYRTVKSDTSYSPYQAATWDIINHPENALAVASSLQYFIPMFTLMAFSPSDDNIVSEATYGVAMWYEGDRIHTKPSADDGGSHVCKFAAAEMHEGRVTYLNALNENDRNGDRTLVWNIPRYAITPSRIAPVFPLELDARVVLRCTFDSVLPDEAMYTTTSMTNEHTEWARIPSSDERSVRRSIVFSNHDMEVSGLTDVIAALLPDFAAAEQQLVALTQ